MMKVIRAAVLAWLVSGGVVQGARTVMEWDFRGATEWKGWSPNGQITQIAFKDEGPRFRTAGADPQILSPLFDLAKASNSQWIEIDLTSDGGGTGEFFFTNTTAGQYSGLQQKWMTALDVPEAGRQTVRVWPFWASLARIVRLRIDPPSGLDLQIHAIRIMEADAAFGAPEWDFRAQGSRSHWSPMHGARLEQCEDALSVVATRPQAVVLAPVTPFDASERSVLRIDAECAGEDLLTLYWGTEAEPKLFGEPIPLSNGRRGADESFDLRAFPMWQGRITHLAIGFGTRGREKLTVRSLAIERNDPARPCLRLRHFGFTRPIVRAGQKATVRATFEHAGGPASAAMQVRLQTDAKIVCASPGAELVPIEPGKRAQAEFEVSLREPGLTRFTVQAGEQAFTRSLRIDEPVKAVRPADYDVPAPRPVKTRYDLGIYYFPGWSPDQYDRWTKQADFPERDPVLGWYAEGMPEVADWHIKWAVENGLSFFIYDWYWRDGKETLGAGLNDGFLKARYRDQLKFALMWANHKPFSSHTPEQLLAVTDYWIEHYLRRGNYLTVGGKPYVSFFVPGELVADLGSEEAVAKAFDAMRARVRAAGLPGLHIGGCSDSLEMLKRAGFDSATAYNYPRAGSPLEQTAYLPFLLAHEPIWERLQKADVLPYIPLLTVNWDSRPWAGPRAWAHFARSPEAFKQGLTRLKANLDARGERMAILEAWNEWGEGSYLEPNAEFGFKDLEVIRAVFAEPGDWPANVGPGDVGLDGRYDLRLIRSESGAAAPPKGGHPSVVSGLQVVAEGNRLRVSAGEAKIGGRTVRAEAAALDVPPAETIAVTDLPMRLVDGAVQTWHLGNRLLISAADRRNVLPGSYVKGSLSLQDASGKLIPTSEVNLDDTWGAFSLREGGSLKAGDEVKASYRLSLRRVDSVVVTNTGAVRLIPGRPSPDCPLVPAVPDEALRLANVYRPFNTTNLEAGHIYVVTREQTPDLAPIRNQLLEPVLGKLRAGQEVRIVCWGDSVTACGESSSPLTCYVGLLASMLRERFAAAKLRVINASIGGSSTPGRLPAFQQEVLDHKPDIVTLEFVNDMGIPGDQLEKLYAEILRQTQAAGAVLVLITPHFTMPSWMGFTDGHARDPRPAVAFLKRFAATHGLPLADASRRWELLASEGIPYEILLRNGINHPEDRGHRMFAEELMRLFPR